MISIKNLKKPEILWLLLIIGVAAVLRFYHYGTFSYSNDEMSALNRLHYDTFSELVQKGFYVDGHPGGIQTFLWQWVRHFGDTEWAVRLPFVLMGILSVWMSFKVAKYMFGVSAGLFTAAALTFLQFPLLYSQIARPYGPGMLFGLMLVYYWLQIFFNNKGELNIQKPGFTQLAGFALSAALCMYTHYFSFLFALIVGFSGFIVARRNNILPYIFAAMVAALLFVPHIPITLNHLTFKGLGLWLGVPGKLWIFEHLYFIFDQSLYILIIFFFTLLALLYLKNEKRRHNRYSLFLVAWFLAPVLIGYIYSIKVNPVLQHPVLIFSFPYFIILIFSYAGNKFGRKKQWLLALFLCAGVIGTTAVNRYYSRQHFGEFKDIARLTAHWQQQFGDSAITKVININNPIYIDYYLAQNQAKAKFALYNINDLEGLKELSAIVRKSNTPYFLYAITKPTPDEGLDIVRSIYPYVIDMQTYGTFSSIYLFGRENGKSFEKASHLSLLKNMKANLPLSMLSPDHLAAAEEAYKMDSLTEYSAAIEQSLDEFRKQDHILFTAETEMYTPAGSGGAVLVISIETAEGKSIQWKGAAAEYVEMPGKWCHIINTLKMDSDIPKGAKLKAYFWDKDKKTVYLKNLACSINK